MLQVGLRLVLVQLFLVTCYFDGAKGSQAVGLHAALLVNIPASTSPVACIALHSLFLPCVVHNTFLPPPLPPTHIHTPLYPSPTPPGAGGEAQLAEAVKAAGLKGEELFAADEFDGDLPSVADWLKADGFAALSLA